MSKVLLLAVAATIAAGSGIVKAATSYDANVITPPGVFFGTGNTNGGFTVETDATDGIELGLRAKLAIISPPLAPVGGNTNVYDVPVGSQPAQANHIPAMPSRSAWGVDYSINVGKSDNLSNYIAELTVVDLTAGGSTITTWDVLGNSTISEPKVTDDDIANTNGTFHTKTGIGSGDYDAQNSENASYFSGLNFNLLHDYTFTLSIYNYNGGVAGTELASDTIEVDVVPAPLPSAASMGLGMLGLVGAAGWLHRKQQTA